MLRCLPRPWDSQVGSRVINAGKSWSTKASQYAGHEPYSSEATMLKMPPLRGMWPYLAISESCSTTFDVSGELEFWTAFPHPKCSWAR